MIRHRAILWCAGLAAVVAGRVHAGPHEYGVLLGHIAPGIEYTSGEAYEGRSDVDDCSDAVCWAPVPEDPEQAVLIYILASFHESPGPIKVHSFEFGLGQYDMGSFSIADYGYGSAVQLDEVNQLASSGWPGPNEGIAVAWKYVSACEDELQELYWFAGYVYGPVEIPLGKDPTQDFAGVAVSEPPPSVRDDFEQLGTIAFGSGAEGDNPCNEGPIEHWGACCVGSDCEEMYLEDCEYRGGTYQGDGTDCFPDPCKPAVQTTWWKLKRLYSY